ncbi:hypothetical protein [Actinoplanes regularis]|uniref:hypothetical protein n=1 Tax=Actinoplanes regularis TaxID=52697 RepID=UPI002555F075|nr:hypothetical protein [Actinoplanes regularis]
MKLSSHLLEKPQVTERSFEAGGVVVVFVAVGFGLAEVFDGFGVAEELADADGVAEDDTEAEGDAETEADGDEVADSDGDSASSGVVVDSAARRSVAGCTISASSPADAGPPARTPIQTTRPIRMAAARLNIPRARKNWRSL